MADREACRCLQHSGPAHDLNPDIGAVPLEELDGLGVALSKGEGVSGLSIG